MIEQCPNCDIKLTPYHTKNGISHECSKCNFTAPKNYLKIKEMFAYVSVDPSDNNEGLVTIKGPTGPMPMVGADWEMAQKLKPIAKDVEKRSGVKVKLLRFSKREEIDF